jgi:CRP-like cAMP-binding protein
MLPRSIPIVLPEYLRKKAHVKLYKKDEMIILPYQKKEYIYIIREGLVKVYGINAHGEEFIHALYGPNDIFSLTSVFSEMELEVFYQALDICEIERIPTDDFVVALKRDAALSFVVIQQIVEQLTVYKSRVDNLEYKYARERLIYRVLLLGYRFGEKIEGVLYLPAITQENIGRTINLSRETASKALKRLERRGFIVRRHGRIGLLDIEGLAAEIGTTANPPHFLNEIRKL